MTQPARRSTVRHRARERAGPPTPRRRRGRRRAAEAAQAPPRQGRSSPPSERSPPSPPRKPRTESRRRYRSSKKDASCCESAAALPAQARAGNSRRPRWRSRVHPGERRRQTNIRLDTPRRRRRERWRLVPVAKQRGRPREDCLPRLSEGSRRQIRDYATNSTLHRGGRDTRMRGTKWDAGPLEPMWHQTRPKTQRSSPPTEGAKS